LIQILKEIFLERKSAEWIELLVDAGVPCAPVQTIDQVFRAPQVLQRQMLTEVEHPTVGKVQMAGLPLKFSDTPASVRLAPPLLGQHSEEILRDWLTMAENEIVDLKSKGII